MVNREILSKEHAELDGLAVQLLALVAKQPAETTALSTLRWRLNHVLMVHLAKEDNLLYPQLKSSTIPATRMLATRFADEMGGLAATYLAYSTRWTVVAVEADWAGFAADTRTVMRALRQRILREERELYPMLDRQAA